MKKLFLGVSLLVASVAYADTAIWTGRSEFTTSVTGKSITRCEYNLYGQKFWKNFLGTTSCPSSIEVE